ncbi:MAG: Tfp pilus assembly protein PilF [Prochloraceae cyanobacterium]|nr:Tfp pilus assembly protein PilF [Prochloraceae cyanobacterium]
MSQTKRKRSPWLYLLLGLMVVSLVGFTIFPVGISFLSNNNLVEPAAATNIPGEAQPQDELELQAKGYQLVLNREPENQTALRGLIEIRLQQGNIEATIEPLTSLVNLNPDITDYGILLAQTQQQVGKYEEAIATYRQVLDGHLDSILALQGLVNLFLDRELPNKAIATLKDSIKTAREVNLAKPGAIDIVGMDLLLAQVYAFSEDYDRAISTYDNAIALDEKDFRPVVSKALILQKQGDLEAAKPLFAKAVALAPEYQKQIEAMAGEAIALETEITPTEAAKETPQTAPEELTQSNSETENLDAIKEDKDRAN